MFAIIPVKASSIRVKNKNFRPFYGEKSLCEIQIEKLLKVLPSNKIYLSSEALFAKSIADRYHINFLLRENRLCNNDTPITDVIKGIYMQTGLDEDCAWCQVTNPLFDSHKACFDLWNNHIDKSIYDSLVVAHKLDSYVLDASFHPLNFGFGPWHLPSQKRHQFYHIDFCLSILTPSAIKQSSYYVGQNPYWYVSNSPSVDIDTIDDFSIAQLSYSQHISNKNII